MFTVIAVYAVIAVFRMHKADPFKDLDLAKVNAVVKISTTKASDDPRQAIMARARALVDTEDWSTLSAEIQSAERSFYASDGAMRDYGLMSYGARSELISILEVMVPERCQKKIANILTRLEAAANAAPQNHILAGLMARLHLDVGWEWRGDGFADSVSALEWSHMNQHYEAAEKWVAPFTEGGITSPYVAHAAHIHARRLGDDGHRVRAIYDVWRAFDPGNPLMYKEHGFHLLPR